MWIVLGSKEKTERVPGGRQVERKCSECGETAMFYERRATSTLQIYFLDVYEYGSRCVMACGACGALFAADAAVAEGAPKTATGFETFLNTAERTGRTIATAAERAYERITASRPAEPANTRRHGSLEASQDDPLAADDAALEARFRDLERRVRIADD